MRHQKNKVTLDRLSSARRSLLANLAESLIIYERITTTKAKAKAVERVVEKLITTSKKKNLASRRELQRYLYTENAVKKLVEQLSGRYAERKGGYTRVILMTPRKGDGAERAMIELV